jgi:D-psicose/D-tagatose/L-ribulose 3-epimerase
MKLTYAVHAYAWTSGWTSDDLPILDRAASLGLEALEVPLMELEGIDPAAIRERAAAAGIALLTSTACDARTDPTSEDPAVRRAAVEYLRRCVEATAAMGATLFTGVTYSAIGARIEGRPTEEHWERAADVLRETARHAAEHGVTVGIEAINRYETFLVNTAEQALGLADRVGEPNVGIHLDAYHMNIEEDDFSAPVRAVVDRLVHVHLSESHRGIPGRGTVDWESLYRELAAAGYEGFVGLEAFVDIAPAMRAATCMWRDMAASSDELVSEGLRFFRDLEQRVAAVPA